MKASVFCFLEDFKKIMAAGMLPLSVSLPNFFMVRGSVAQNLVARK